MESLETNKFNSLSQSYTKVINIPNKKINPSLLKHKIETESENESEIESDTDSDDFCKGECNKVYECSCTILRYKSKTYKEVRTSF